MVREEALSTDGMWAGFVRTAPHDTSGWHHHGEYETSIYVVAGQVRMESGLGGGDVILAGPGDFFYLPPGARPREGHPGAHEAHLVGQQARVGPAPTHGDPP